ALRDGLREDDLDAVAHGTAVAATSMGRGHGKPSAARDDGGIEDTLSPAAPPADCRRWLNRDRFAVSSAAPDADVVGSACPARPPGLSPAARRARSAWASASHPRPDAFAASPRW